jgi:Tol biopolymer transport system component
MATGPTGTAAYRCWLAGCLFLSLLIVTSACGQTEGEPSEGQRQENIKTVEGSAQAIAFSSYRDGRLMDVYVMNLDGSGVVRLTESAAEDHQPSWSPDGSRIALSSTRSVSPPHVRGHIYVTGADGTGETRLVSELDNAGSPAWSPDGARIAFAGCCRPGWDIYVIDADGTNILQLTRDDAFDYDPTWSPDSSRIAFARDGNGTGPRLPSHGIYVMDADGTRLHQIVRRDMPGIHVLDVRSGDVVRLTDRQDTEPTWSPDGSDLAFTSYRVNGEGDIFVMRADGTRQARLTDNLFGDYDPAWQPVNSTLVDSSSSID